MPDYNPRTGEWTEPIQHNGGMFGQNRIIRSKEQAAWFASLTTEQLEQCNRNEVEWKQREENNYIY